ncbi:MAG TPA: ABC transporter permease [Acidimicrobiia bacterium]|nr:ABC transporter permease [Acidimicrobiia bacterium]
MRSLIRSLAFLRKELVSVWRQPRLIATLVLGPFLILFLFGLGYQELPEPFRTVVVAGQDGSAIGVDASELDEAFGEGIDLVEVSDDLDSARQSLVSGEIDLVLVAPEDGLEALERGEQATFSIFHAEIDPVMTGSIDLLARLSVDQINQEVLTGIVEQARTELSQTDGPLADALEDVPDIDPALLVSPFTVETSPVTEQPPSQAAYYAPGVLILLVQHLALTFAALSLVRERQLGMTEMFRVSPLTVREAMSGKYLSFLVLGMALASGLALTMPLLGIEVQGPLWSFALIVALVIFASLGLGFALSGLAKSDSQAVQYSMVVLLVSIFFTGFVLPLDQLTVPVRWVSYLVPGTYGIAGLQDVIFRGQPAPPSLMGALLMYGLVMVALAWLAVRKDVEPANAPAVEVS